MEISEIIPNKYYTPYEIWRSGLLYTYTQEKKRQCFSFMRIKRLIKSDFSLDNELKAKTMKSRENIKYFILGENLKKFLIKNNYNIYKYEQPN